MNDRNWHRWFRIYYGVAFVLFTSGAVGAMFVSPIFHLKVPWLWLGLLGGAILTASVAQWHLKRR